MPPEPPPSPSDSRWSDLERPALDAVALSSVAGGPARASNFVYGSTKTGMDGLYSGLADSLTGTGVSVLLVRP